MNLSRITKKRNRNYVPVETKKAIINAITQRRLKCREVAKIFDVNYGTVRSISQSFKKFGNVQDRNFGRNRKPKITDEGINIIKSEIRKNSTVSLVHIKQKLKEAQQLDVSTTTIFHYIRKLKIMNDCKLFARVKYEKYQNEFQIQDKIISYYVGLSTKFDEIFSMTDKNHDIFQSMKPILDSFYSGYDGSIILLGSSRSSNMHTMYGSDSEPGLFALIINYIYNDLMEKCKKEIIMRISYMEITRDKILDLLNPCNEKVSVVFNPSTKQTKFTNLQRYLCQSEELALDVKQAGYLRRGPKSLRSHFVFRFSMEIIDYQNSDGIVTKSTISNLDFVDMLPEESPEFFEFIHKTASGESPAIEDASDRLLPVLCKTLLGQCQSIYLFHIQLTDVSETKRILEDASAMRQLKHEVPVRQDHMVLKESHLSDLSRQLTDLVGVLCHPSDFGVPAAPVGHLNMLQALEKGLITLRDESAGEILCTRFNELFVYCRLLKERLVLSSSRLTELERAVTTLQEIFQSSVSKPRTKKVLSSVPKPSTGAILSSIQKPSNSVSKTTWVPSNTNTIVSDSSLHFTNNSTLISKKPIISTSIPTVTIGPSTHIPTAMIGPSTRIPTAMIGPSTRIPTAMIGPSTRIPMAMIGPSTRIPTTTIGPPTPIPRVSIGPTSVNPKYMTPIPVIKLLPEPPRVDMESESLNCEGRVICTPAINKIQSKLPAYCIKVVRLNSSTDK